MSCLFGLCLKLEIIKNSDFSLLLLDLSREKVTIPANKPCIFLEGAGSKLTSIEWGDHMDTCDSATFTSSPDNIVAKGISFKVEN